MNALQRRAVGAASLRWLSTQAGSSLLLREFAADRRHRPQLAPFELSPEQATQAFLRWQRRRNPLAPGGLLAPGTCALRRAWLPFWVFDAEAEVLATGSVEGPAPGAWREVEWTPLGRRRFAGSLPEMQVYASFRHRRDFADAAARPGAALPPALPPLALADAERGEAGVAPGAGGGSAPLDAPAMGRGMAWGFALRALQEAEAGAAAVALAARHGAARARGVRVRVAAARRSARLVFVPAYALDYTWGEAFNVHGERRPERFHGMVGGAGWGGVAAEARHVSPHRAAAAGAAAAAAALAPALAAGGLAPAAAAVYAAAAGAAAALAARLAPVLARQAAEDARVAREEADLDRVVAMGLGPAGGAAAAAAAGGAGGAPDPGGPGHEQDELWDAVEWRRWAQADARSWDGARRARWAAELWRSQRRRRAERAAAAAAAAAEGARRAQEDERERRRRRRFGGGGAGHHHHAHHGAHGHAFAGGRRAGGRADHLGYYRALGLAAGGAPPTPAEVKAAFRAAALRLHPDRAAARGGGARAGAAAERERREAFHRARAAYEVLRDAERRRRYDRGEAVGDGAP